MCCHVNVQENELISDGENDQHKDVLVYHTESEAVSYK